MSTADYEIITDSASNLTDDLLNEYNIRMISYVSTIDGEEFLCHERGRDYEESGRKFYNAMRDGADVHTSLINMGAFRDFFEPILREGKDILFISISGGLSGTIQAAGIAADDLMEEYPDRVIRCIDSRSASLGEGLMVMKMSRLRAAGATLDEAVRFYEENKMKMNHIFTVGDLKYLKKGGRISAAEAAIGNLLSIKPILKADDNGKIVMHDKIRLRKKALEYLINMTKERIVHPERQIIAICHCDAKQESEYIASRLSAELPVEDVIVRYYDLCTGSHVGPGTIAIFFMGENRMEPVVSAKAHIHASIPNIAQSSGESPAAAAG
ncbi:MAG: DegV family protein [Lachnospiraceae bacterium]|nr:DegV family protein [Lachnospiraceae bacterium]